MLQVLVPPPPPIVTIKVLSVHPPWAHLLATGVKPCLAMGTQSLYRGWVAIRVPDCVPEWAVNISHLEPFNAVLRGVDEDWLRARGCLVGLARIVGCHTRGRKDDLWEQNTLYGDYKPGSWLWEFDAFRTIPEPVICNGKVGIRDLTTEVLGRVLAQVGPDELV